jgi:hypothetical protein
VARQRERSWPRSLWLEHAFIPAILGGVGYALIFLYYNGYLPQPFFYEPAGTFMDWFSLAYWARHVGAFDVEGAIYPPISFLVLRLIGDDRCYLLDGVEPRACDWHSLVAIGVIYVVDVILTAVIFFKLDRRTALPRAIAVAVGLPMLYAVERGNLVTLCFAFLMLAYGPLLRSARLRWLCAGIAVNFKVYLIAGILAPLLKRRWLAVEGALVSVVAVYGLTWWLFGSGSPIEIYDNIRQFSSSFVAGGPLDLWYPSSYNTAIALLRGTNFPITAIIGSRPADLGVLFLELFTNFNRLAIMAAALAIWLRPEVVPLHRVVFFGIAFALMTSEAGGYTEILLLPFVFMETWRGIARPAALLLAYVLCIPMEIVVASLPSGVVRESYLGGREVIAFYGVGLMSLLRPGLIQLISTLLAAATLHDVWRDVRVQGWRQRWRFRRDMVILPGVLRPVMPSGDVATPNSERQ